MCFRVLMDKIGDIAEYYRIWEFFSSSTFFSKRVSSLRLEIEIVAVPELAKAWAITDLILEPPRHWHWLKAEEE